jgi:glutamate 5-kinase
VLREVAEIDATVEGLARDRPGGLSKGGMASKITAARIVTEAGGSCVIAPGRSDDVLERICRGDPVGTLFTGRSVAMPAWKRWLAWSADARGTVAVDAGAREAVVDRGRSLLAAGVVAVDGGFQAGDVVALATERDGVFARGLVNYPADELRRIAGVHTDRIAALLGYCPYDEVVHRDNLALLSRGRPTGGATAGPGQDA